MIKIDKQEMIDYIKSLSDRYVEITQLKVE